MAPGMNSKGIFGRPEVRLVLFGAAILFWELVLIRWMGSCIRVVAYYTNFILISSFFGLGAGALLVRFRRRFWKWLIPLLAVCIMLGPLLGGFQHPNPQGEFVWRGAPMGIMPQDPLPPVFGAWPVSCPYWLLLLVVYMANAVVFMVFGQRLGVLFQELPPLRAYAFEIGGSICGILLFAAVSSLSLPPPVWFVLGFALVLGVLDLGRRGLAFSAVCAAAAILIILPFSNFYLWSQYYKIQVSLLDRITETKTRQEIQFIPPVGFRLAVNNDYHQMIVDLHPRGQEHPFLQSWRLVYDAPYRAMNGVPPGPVLIVGAGTGNDVSAALRAGIRSVDAVEIDPMIVELGRLCHPERPYANPNVRVIVDDARSFFVKTGRRYSMVVFGFLDSHTLMSSFSSLRLDNFVYTREAMERVKELLLPGGKVYVTFVSTEWLDQRMIRLLDSVFDEKTLAYHELDYGYANGIVYVNGKSAVPAPKLAGSGAPGIRIPTDDWPFLYLKDATLPAHYRAFIAMVVVLGLGSMLLLPKGERQVKFPYFFMGAGFFLIETSNVVSLSLLYGSTWIVNAAVFTGILVLILLGTLACSRMRPQYPLLFGLLFASLVVAYLTRTSFLLGIDSAALKLLAAGAIFLGPIFLASLIFGQLIKEEKFLYQAYGSNLLGAVIGGSCEYLSMVIGLKSLLLITLVFYIMAMLSIQAGRRELSS